MTATIEVDEQTYRSLEFAARISNTTAGEVVARLVAAASMPDAARAVVAHYKPGISPNRNGWSFWTLDDGSGRLLQSIRRS